MRYSDGGGLTASGRARREQVRLQAAAMFDHGSTPPQVAMGWTPQVPRAPGGGA